MVLVIVDKQQPPPQQSQSQPCPLLLDKWRCRACAKVLLEHSPAPLMRGVVVKICEKCGTINRMKDGLVEG